MNSLAFLMGLAAFLTPGCILYTFYSMLIFSKLGGTMHMDKKQFRKLILRTLLLCLIFGIGYIMLITLMMSMSSFLLSSYLEVNIYFKIFLALLLVSFGLWMIGAFDDLKTTKVTQILIMVFLSLSYGVATFGSMGPIVSTILIESSDGQFWTPIIALLFFLIGAMVPMVIILMLTSNWLLTLKSKPSWVKVQKVLGIIYLVNAILLFFI